MATSRATYARQWRLGARQSRRFDTLASDYVLTKYPAIHKEIAEFYGTLNTKYSTKHNLTKTPEYRLWKTEQGMDRTTTEQGTSSTTPPTTTEQEMTYEPEQGTSSTTPTTTTEQEMTYESEQGTSSTTPTTTTEQETSDEPQYDLDLDGMDSVINNIINELSQDEEIRALLDQPFDFEECYW